jgi:mycothiol synthase
MPDDVTIRTFVPGADDDPWLALNARAFADHPEQGAWTAEDLRRRMNESWFDPAGFFLAERADSRELIGFHWTKVHGSQSGHATDHPHDHPHEHSHGHGHEPIGEIYVLGVDPDAHARGLGRLLSVVGLRHLRSKGLLDVMLYVDESNTPAIKLYESLGFTRFSTDVLFSRPSVGDHAQGVETP